MRPVVIQTLVFGILAGCAQSSPEDRAALVGLWLPEDGSPHTVQFKHDGEFDFIYEVTPAPYVLRLQWSLGRKGRINLASGGTTITCHYAIEDDRLSIDNGSGGECVRSATTPTTLMPRSFMRAP